MPYFDWVALKNHRAQYAVIEVEDGELVNIHFRKVAYDYEAELELAKFKGLPFIEMYEELRRDDNYRGHNLRGCVDCWRNGPPTRVSQCGTRDQIGRAHV